MTDENHELPDILGEGLGYLLGWVALGETLTAALELAFEVETLAEQYFKTLLLDAVHLLPDDEMAMMVEKFKTYGQKGQD